MSEAANKLGLFAMKSAFKCSFYRNDTGDLALYFRQGNDLSFESSSDPIPVMGGGTKVMTFDGETEASLSIKSQITSVDIMAIQTGNKLETGATYLVTRTHTGVSSGGDDVITLPNSESAHSNEILAYVVGKDGETILKKLDEATVSGTSATLTGLESGQNYLISYKVEKEVNKTSFSSTKQDDVSYTLIVDTFAKAKADDKMKPIQLRFPKVTIQNSYVLGLSAKDVTDFELKMDVMADNTEKAVAFEIVEL